MYAWLIDSHEIEYQLLIPYFWVDWLGFFPGEQQHLLELISVAIGSCLRQNSCHSGH